MRRLAALLAGLLVLVVSLPWLGPLLGLADYRSATRPPATRVELDAGRFVNVESRGAGPDVVLVHGLPGDVSQLAELAGALVALGYRTHTYDRVGWGHSSRRRGDEPPTLERHAHELVLLTRRLSLERPVWLGYSYGGGVVQHADAIAPQASSARVLIASVGPAQERRTPGVVDRLLFSPAVLRWMLGTDFTARGFSAGAMRSLFAPETEPPPDAVDRLLAGVALPGVPTTWVREARTERRWPERPVRAPVLLIHGSGDGSVPVAVGRDLAARTPGARLVEIADGSHALPATRPAEIAARIDRFLRSARD